MFGIVVACNFRALVGLLRTLSQPLRHSAWWLAATKYSGQSTVLVTRARLVIIGREARWRLSCDHGWMHLICSTPQKGCIATGVWDLWKASVAGPDSVVLTRAPGCFPANHLASPNSKWE